MLPPCIQDQDDPVESLKMINQQNKLFTSGDIALSLPCSIKGISDLVVDSERYYQNACAS
jgi:hypothetical protein